jgi:hypothetical protein
MIRIAYMTVTLCLLVGCASEPPSMQDDSTAVARVLDVPVIPTATGWLDASDAKVQAKAETCHMLRIALADSSHSWLWLEIDLPERRHVRVLGQGSLTFGLIAPDGPREVRDAGLFVALTQNANTFLNSSSGPITIRAAHAATVGGRVRLLARLPVVDTASTVVHHVKPVPERWIQK